jgi:hypothetical protein
LADGVKLLFTLLTSPSATVNLVHGGSSAVQGMCNADACRALVCLFAPKIPIRPRAKESLFPEQEQDKEQDHEPLLLSAVPALSAGPGRSHSGRSVEVRAVLRLQSDISELQSLTGAFPAMRPWLWTYYSKSGAVKNSYVGYMCMTSGTQQIFGRGVDMNGAFEMSGAMTQTIDGVAWVTYKAYISETEVFNTSLVDSVEEWVMQACPNPNGTSPRSVLKAHVAHTLYFAGSDIDGNFQAGFYGVWEMAGKDTHFQLDMQKGGVLRVTPIL